MIVDRVVVGSLEENCYILSKEDKVVIIDPGDEANKIIQKVGDKTVVGILITHHHFDHVGALEELENYYHVKESKEIPGWDFEVLNTPGHTSDSVCYYFAKDKMLFAGDFLFLDSIGRTDLAGGSDYEMKNSLEFISQFPDDIKVFPGHGDATTLGHEKNNFKYYY